MEATPRSQIDHPDLDRFQAVAGDLSEAQRRALARRTEEAGDLYDQFEDSSLDQEDLLYGIAVGLEIADRHWGESRPELVYDCARIHLEQLARTEGHRELVESIDMDAYCATVFEYRENTAKPKRPGLRRQVPSVDVQRMVSKSMTELKAEVSEGDLDASKHIVAIIKKVPPALKQRLPMMTEQMAGVTVAISRERESIRNETFVPVLELTKEQQIEFFKRVILYTAEEVAGLKASQEQWQRDHKQRQANKVR